MSSKVLTIFDSRLSTNFTFWSKPPVTNKFPLFGQTSIQFVDSITTECQIKPKMKQEILLWNDQFHFWVAKGALPVVNLILTQVKSLKEER